MRGLETLRSIVRVGAVLTLQSGFLPIACNNEPSSPAPVSRPEATKTLTPDIKKAQWENLSAVQKLNKLLVRDYPTFVDFDRQKEVTLASAEAFCQLIKCNISPEQLVEKTHYVDEDTFIQKMIDEDPFHKPTPEQLKQSNKQMLALASSTGETYINQNSLNKFVETITTKRPNALKQIDYQDLRTVHEIDTLVHEWLHQIIRFSNKEPIAFDKFYVQPSDRQDSIKFDKLINFIIEGKDSQDIKYTLGGGNEAVADFAALILVHRKMKLHYLTNPLYGQGVDLMERLNKMAGITDDEFLKYASGELPPTDLLIKWGSFKRDQTRTDLSLGILTLANIGLAVQENISFEDAEKRINGMLKLKSN